MLLIKKHYNSVETSIIIPSVIDVINDVFKPFIKICGEILLISETELNAVCVYSFSPSEKFSFSVCKCPKLAPNATPKPMPRAILF